MEEPGRLEGVRDALEAALRRLIGHGAASLLVAEGDGWSWGIDLPAAACLLQVPQLQCVGRPLTTACPVHKEATLAASIGSHLQKIRPGALCSKGLQSGSCVVCTAARVCWLAGVDTACGCASASRSRTAAAIFVADASATVRQTFQMWPLHYLHAIAVTS